MADGKMECVPKKEIKECYFFPIVSTEEDGIWLGDVLVSFVVFCFVFF